MKITVTEKTETTKEIEITFPYYRCQQDRWWYKLIDKENVICIEILPSLDVVKVDKDYLWAEGNVFHKDSKEITEEEFNNKLKQALLILNTL